MNIKINIEFYIKIILWNTVKNMTFKTILNYLNLIYI